MMRLIGVYIASLLILGCNSGERMNGNQLNQGNKRGSYVSSQSGDVERRLFADTPSFYRAMQGTWTGTYRLWLNPNGPPDVSTSQATVHTVADAAFCLFSYRWSQADRRHEGVFFLSGGPAEPKATWGDSFHSVPDPMQCAGLLDKDSRKLVFYGGYFAGDGWWGWRTEFWVSESGKLTMEAYNITPSGDEKLAVRCNLEKK